MKIDGEHEGNIKWVMRDIFFDEIGSLGGLKYVKSGVGGPFVVFLMCLLGTRGACGGVGGETIEVKEVSGMM